MVVIPGLSGLLKSVDKHVTSWDDSGSRLLIKLAGIFALVGLLPGLVIYTVSYQFVSAQTMRKPAAIFVISSS